MISRMADSLTQVQLTSECMGTMFGGVINLANMLPYGAFNVCEDEVMQEKLAIELQSIWVNPNDCVPSYNSLIMLPLLVRRQTSLIFYL